MTRLVPIATAQRALVEPRCGLLPTFWPTIAQAAEEASCPTKPHEVGWSVLHQDVSLFVAQQLISTLDDLHCVDRDIQREFVALRRELVKQRDAGTPWLARGAADVLAMLDMTAWTSVLGLLDEYPVLPAALTAMLEGRTTTVSPTAFDFISTAAQIGDIRNLDAKAPRRAVTLSGSAGAAVAHSFLRLCRLSSRAQSDRRHADVSPYTITVVSKRVLIFWHGIARAWTRGLAYYVDLVIAGIELRVSIER